MKAQIISISSIPRISPRQRESDFSLEGFTKALALVQNLNCKAALDQRVTVEGMAMEGLLTPDEHAAVCEFFQWSKS